ncbi:MAG: nucleotide exchange factor GrpE [Halobacteriovorax sp.]|nr:nucleotide exchange factor GrpE [Halobacteriovorax sp.]|tara:strand:- start:180072 stop:180656 length:585 start_codon:yes stop_codon:yes gene_type:complete
MRETEEKVEVEVEVEASAEGDISVEDSVVEESEGEQVANEEDNVEVLEPKKEEEDFKAKYLYLAAEMENMRRRYEREKEGLIKYGNEKVLSGLLDVVDNLDRTLEAISSDEDEKIKNIVTGIEMVRNQFLEVLKNNGLEEVKALGEEFDPNFHEALAQQPAEGKNDQEILSVFQKGYVLNGRLLRAAKVIVVKN